VSDERVALGLDWGALDHHLAAMAVMIAADGAPTVVVGLLRGGMVPAVLLAHRLGVRDVRGLAVCRTVADGPNAAKHPPVVADSATLGLVASGADVLVVDDVAGTGSSMAAATDVVRRRGHAVLGPSRVRRAVVVVNTANWSAVTDVSPHESYDYIGTTCAGWVRFPWEIR
jgi:hypoxanthine phosphoribosyltransferase